MLGNIFFVTFMLFGTLLVNCKLVNQIEEETVIEDYFICRNCGNDISPSNFALSTKISKIARALFNETLYKGNKPLLVQELDNDLTGIRYQVFMTKIATCANLEGWLPTTWFPDYAWKLCLCPNCGTRIGWMFEPIKSAMEDNPNYPSDDGFYAIIVDNIISETYSDSLLMCGFVDN